MCSQEQSWDAGHKSQNERTRRCASFCSRRRISTRPYRLPGVQLATILGQSCHGISSDMQLVFATTLQFVSLNDEHFRNSCDSRTSGSKALLATRVPYKGEHESVGNQVSFSLNSHRFREADARRRSNRAWWTTVTPSRPSG